MCIWNILNHPEKGAASIIDNHTRAVTASFENVDQANEAFTIANTITIRTHIASAKHTFPHRDIAIVATHPKRDQITSCRYSQTHFL